MSALVVVQVLVLELVLEMVLELVLVLVRHHLPPCARLPYPSAIE